MRRIVSKSYGRTAINTAIKCSIAGNARLEQEEERESKAMREGRRGIKGNYAGGGRCRTLALL